MITNFDKFEKTNNDIDELKSIRVKNFNIFKKKGFPTKREENWKYADLKMKLQSCPPSLSGALLGHCVIWYLTTQ